MTGFMQRSARHFMLIKAARELRGGIEKVGLDTLKILADSGTSIVSTYLNSCSPQEKTKLKQQFNALLQMGISGDMLLTELIGQMPELMAIIENKPDYRRSELLKLEEFLEEG